MRVSDATSLKHTLVLLIVTIVMIFLYGRIDYTVEPYAGWDLSSYREMASASPRIAVDVGQPFAYRLLGPYAAGLLPLPDPAAFRVLSTIVSVAVILALYFFMRFAGVSPFLSMVTAAFVTFNRYWFGFTSWDYFQVNDALAILFIIVMFWSMLGERWAVFGIALALGAATRESCMLMVPVLLTYLIERKRPRHTWRSALMAVLPGLAVFAALRVVLPVTKGSAPFDALLAYGGKIKSPERLFRLLVNSWVPFSLLPLAAFDTTVRFFRTRRYALVFVVLVFLSALFGANDERLTAPGLVICYVLLAAILRDLEFGAGTLAVCGAAGLLSSLHHIFARYPLPDRGFTTVLSLGALVFVTGTAILRRRSRSRVV